MVNAQPCHWDEETPCRRTGWRQQARKQLCRKRPGSICWQAARESAVHPCCKGQLLTGAQPAGRREGSHISAQRLWDHLGPVWVPQHKDSDISEQVQWRLSRWFGLEHTAHKENPRELGLFSLERKQEGDLTVICYSLMCPQRHTGKAERQWAQHKKFWWDARKTVIVSMVTHWNRKCHHFSGPISGDGQPVLTLNSALLSAGGGQSSLQTFLPAKLPQKSMKHQFSWDLTLCGKSALRTCAFQFSDLWNTADRISLFESLLSSRHPG